MVCAKGFVLKDPSKNMASCTNEGYWQAGSGVACVPGLFASGEGRGAIFLSALGLPKGFVRLAIALQVKLILVDEAT